MGLTLNSRINIINIIMNIIKIISINFSSVQRYLSVAFWLRSRCH